MDAHTIELLEFERIRETVGEYCLTEEARSGLKTFDFVTDRGELTVGREYVGAFVELLTGTVEFPSVEFPPVADAIVRARKPGAVLEIQDLASVLVYVTSARVFARAIASGVPSTRLAECAAAIPECLSVSKEIARYIDPTMGIRERDIPELRDIRRGITRVKSDIDKIAARYLSDTTMQKYWNSDTPTHRDGRTVLPLNSSFKGRVTGIVHEISASGATLFIEPVEILEKNNELFEFETRYRQEVFRILRRLTELVAEHADELDETVELVTKLDAMRARARYSVLHGCVFAEITADSVFLPGARHPLLRNPVPITLSIESGIRAVVISGPNTGGKTVTLKTVGLLALMNQFGLGIPANDESRLPLFDRIMVDIGDEQSIEGSLSTFSAHLRRISDVIDTASERSLILIDELGTGTDPDEAGALAFAVLDELVKTRCTTIITTHLGAVKNYAFTHDEAMNASVRFDTEKHTPTFEVVLGLPGSSYAIETAEKIGLKSSVVETARAYAENRAGDAAKIIEQLSELTRLGERRIEETENLRMQLERRENQLIERETALESRELALREKRLAEFDAFSADARRTLENLVREIREGELSREKMRKAKQFIEELSTVTDAEKHDIEVSRRRRKIKKPSRPTEIDVGVEVVVTSTGRRGKVIRADRGGKWVVETGSMRVTLHADDLETVVPRKPDKPDVQIAGFSPAQPAVGELDLRGMRLDEAIHRLQTQLDSAILSGLAFFGVIHGKGDGVLQKGIREYLKESRSVESFSYAPPEDGGYGKTIVRLGS